MHLSSPAALVLRMMRFTTIAAQQLQNKLTCIACRKLTTLACMHPRHSPVM
jgi:hypothetical protein